MKHFLVTGGAGFIGSNFIHYILNNTTDIHITNIDALTYAGNLENLSDLELDSRYKFVMGTANLLLHAKRHWTGLDPQNKASFRFLHISTDEVFGSLTMDEPAFNENTPYAPNSPYAASKASSDHLVRSYFHTYGFPAIITNCSNNYGSYQYPEKLIPLVISNAVNGKPLPIYGDGKQIRDWLYVQDHCEALYTVLQRGAAGESYNIGGSNQPANLEIVQMICKILDEFLPDSKFVPHANLIEFVKDRPGHDRRYAMNTTKIKRELGWQPKESLESGLRKTIRWYLDNKDWVNATLENEAHKDWLTQNYESREEEDK